MLNRIVKNYSGKESSLDSKLKEHVEPIVFLNTPITSEDRDAIGITSAVEMVNKAIDNGARIIGVVANYGAGKSSLTELLKKQDTFRKPISVNLWGTLEDNDLRKNDKDDITKSFIYQMARGVSKNTANFANRILNRNYSIISVSVGNLNTLWLYFFACIFFALFLVLSRTNIDSFVSIFGEESRFMGSALIFFAPIALVVAGVLAVAGICFSSLAFSLWKDVEKRETGINEILAAYAYVYKKLSNRLISRITGKRRIIVIDDLDRIEDKEKVIGFLKELYRFNSVFSNEKPREPVFLVSISPEAKLNNNKDTDNPCFYKEDNRLYSKIFDYTITLKPVHYDDYKSVIIQLINSDHENKAKLMKLLDINSIDSDHFPEDFAWIYRGENLTIREVKERLNQAIGLYVDLKNKFYSSNPFISFKACVAVVYLERTYPLEYATLLENEKKFSELIQSAYILRNSEDNTTIRNAVDENGFGFKNKGIIKDLSFLLSEGIIDFDYRMYFYSFPKGSYIKNIDEKDICNYLEYPKDNTYDKDELNNKINRLNDYNKLSCVNSVIDRISRTEDIALFPEVVFDNNTLWKMANNSNIEKTVKSYNSYLDWESTPENECYERICKLSEFVSEDHMDFWNSYVGVIKSIAGISDANTVLKMRKSFICGFAHQIIDLKELFLDDKFPMITEKEIEMLNNPSITVLLVNDRKIDRDNAHYIQTKVLANVIDEKSIKKAQTIQDRIVELLPFERISSEAYSFICYNRIISDTIFSNLCQEAFKGNFDTERIADYLNKLQNVTLTNDYLEGINDLCMSETLEKGICDQLVNNKLYTHFLMKPEETLDYIQDIFNEDEASEVVRAMSIINDRYPDSVPEIRNELAKRNLGRPYDAYKSLYEGDYCIITIKEMQELESILVGLRFLDASKLNIENCEEYIELINSYTYEGKECFILFDSLFNVDNGKACTNLEVVHRIIDLMDFTRIHFKTMDEADIISVLSFLRNTLNLASVDSMKFFMRKTRYIFGEFEQSIIRTQGIKIYLEFLNDENLCSDYIVDYLIEHMPMYELNDEITDSLLKRKAYQHVIVGKTLYNGSLYYQTKEIPVEEYLKQYSTESPIWDYLISNKTFLQTIMDKQLYRNLESGCTYEQLRPLMELKQTSDFLKFVFESLPDVDIIKYLRSMSEITSEEDSLGIYDVLVKEEYIKYLEDDTVFTHVSYRLWDNVKSKSGGYKANLTRKRNDYLKIKNGIMVN